MAKDSHYDKAAADYAVAFISSLCHTKGTWAGKAFELIDWQEQIVRDVFGVLKPNGYRQFNTAYVEIPKKQGKSELAAAIALLLTCGDGEERAEVYGCAADRQQASIVFEVAKDMVTMCPALRKRVKVLASQKRLIYEPTGSIYQVLSADVANKHGFNVHGVIFDELHTQPNRKLYDVMTKGSGDARMQPLYFLITTAGDNQNSICWEVHQKVLDIIEGRKHDPTFYPVIYGAAQEDDWSDPKIWKKANPSLGITVGMDKVKAAFESARQNPAEENSFRQLRLNQLLEAGVAICEGILLGIINSIPTLIENLPTVIMSIIEFFSSQRGLFLKVGIDLLEAIILGILNMIPKALAAVGNLVSGILQRLGILPGEGKSVGLGLIQGIWDGFVSKVAEVMAKIAQKAREIAQAIRNALHVHSPSDLTVSDGKNLAVGLGVGFLDAIEGVKRDIRNALPTDIGSMIGTSVAMPQLALAGASATQTVQHTGVIRVQGVNDEGMLQSVVDIIVDELRQEART